MCGYATEGGKQGCTDRGIDLSRGYRPDEREKGDVALLTQADVFQSNGVIHVIDAVVLPN